MDWTTQSSGSRPELSWAVNFRTSWKRASRACARLGSAPSREEAAGNRSTVAAALWLKLFHLPAQVLLCVPRASDRGSPLPGRQQQDARPTSLHFRPSLGAGRDAPYLSE